MQQRHQNCMTCHVTWFDSSSNVTRCVDHNIHVLNLPAHTTHLLQVADIAVFGPFKRYIGKSLTVYREEHGPYIPPRYYAKATKWAWEQATTRSNCIMGFEKAGIFPFDRTKITAAIYKEGVRLRKLDDDSKRDASQVVAHAPPSGIDSSSSAAALLSSAPALVQSLTSILSPPPLLVSPAPASQRRVGISTTFSRVLTEEQSMNIIREKKEEKERKENVKKENKRKREEKKTAAAEKPKSKRKNSVRLQPTQRKPLSNITNTITTTPDDTEDPYA
jgi:hypothetical protein